MRILILVMWLVYLFLIINEKIFIGNFEADSVWHSHYAKSIPTGQFVTEWADWAPLVILVMCIDCWCDWVPLVQDICTIGWPDTGQSRRRSPPVGKQRAQIWSWLDCLVFPSILVCPLWGWNNVTCWGGYQLIKSFHEEFKANGNLDDDWD